MTDGIAQVRLDDGTVVWARINDLNGPDGLDGPDGPDGPDGSDGPDYGTAPQGSTGSYQDTGGYQDTGVTDRIGDRVVGMAGGLGDVVRGVVRSLRAGIEPTAPVQVSVNFGIELTAQTGKVVSVLADSGGKASVSVSLSWTEPAHPATGDA